MKRIFTILTFVSAVFAGVSCSYSDKLVKDEIGKLTEELSSYENRLGTMKQQLKSASEIFGSKYIVSIRQNAEGKYVLEYYNDKMEAKTIILATKEDIVAGTFFGVREDSSASPSTWYWQLTSDNGKTWTDLKDKDGKSIPVVGGDVSIDIDDNGYWVVNDIPTNALADDVSNILFQSVSHNPETGVVTFVLADGSSYTVKSYEDLVLNMDCPTTVPIANTGTSAELYYYVTGSLASSAVVDCLFSYGVTVTINDNKKCAVVKFKSGYEEGSAVIMASDGPSVAMKAVYFTLGSVVIDKSTWDPKYGTGSEIYLPGEAATVDTALGYRNGNFDPSKN